MRNVYRALIAGALSAPLLLGASSVAMAGESGWDNKSHSGHCCEFKHHFKDDDFKHHFKHHLKHEFKREFFHKFKHDLFDDFKHGKHHCKHDKHDGKHDC